MISMLFQFDSLRMNPTCLFSSISEMHLPVKVGIEQENNRGKVKREKRLLMIWYISDFSEYV